MPSKVTRAAADKVLVVPLFRNLKSETDGTTSAIYTMLDVPEIEDVGPYLDSICFITDTSRKSTNHSWTITCWQSVDGRNWSDPVDLFTWISAAGIKRTSEYTDRTSFGFRLRLGVGQKNTTGAAIETAMLSALAVLVFRT